MDDPESREPATDQRMREVLIALAFLSQGRTQSWNASGGGAPDYEPITYDKRGDVRRLGGSDDDPATYFAQRWDHALDEDDRQRVFDAAKRRLKHARHSEADRTREETPAQRARRIVDEGRGWKAIDVATHFRCGVKEVYAARRAAGCDDEYGELPQSGLQGDALLQVIRQKAQAGMSERQIMLALRVERRTVRRALGREVDYRDSA